MALWIESDVCCENLSKLGTPPIVAWHMTFTFLLLGSQATHDLAFTRAP